MRIRPYKRAAALTASLLLLAAACVTHAQIDVARHRWWVGLGPVLPHESFPTDCKLCHVGQTWNVLVDDFTFDHEAETGVPLRGAHQEARCLRCHNDRGPVATFAAQGCGGCHEDVHRGQLGASCAECHQERTWQPVGQIELHDQTRFPLVGVHAATACNRCHPGAWVGKFLPTDVECVTCHQSDLARALNPNHVGLGWVSDCDRCHIPTTWNQAEIN
jgi:hypothetical protein